MNRSRVGIVKHPAWRGASAMMIGLALALAGCGGSQQTTATATATASATTAPAPPGKWNVTDQASNVAHAPTSIQVMYRTHDLTSQRFLLQRSHDASYSWSSVPWPRVAGARLPADIYNDSALWDPQAPQIVFLWLQLMNDAACPAVDEIPIPIINGIARATSTTGKLCQLMEVSDDSGATWRAVTPPASLTGGMDGLYENDAAPTAGSLSARGSQLYALFQPGVHSAITTPRLAISADGGATWRLLDGPIAAAGQEIMNYVVTPNGASLFALTQPLHFNPASPSGEILPPVQFWSSADGGATWTRGATPPGQRMDGLVAAQDPTTGAPIVYLLSDSSNDIELHLYASLDRGGAWSHSVDLKTRETSAESLHLLTPLPDGGVALFGFLGPDSYAGPFQGGPLSEWRYDWPAAPMVTMPSHMAVVTQVDATPAPGGGIRVWLAGIPDTQYSRSLIEFADLAT